MSFAGLLVNAGVIPAQGASWFVLGCISTQGAPVRIPCSRMLIALPYVRDYVTAPVTDVMLLLMMVTLRTRPATMAVARGPPLMVL